MFDQSNLVEHKSGYALYPQATNPIVAGEAGMWLDTNNQLWHVLTDGTLKPVGGPAAPIAPAVRLATAAALPAYAYSSVAKTITANANGALSIDGVTVNVGDRVLKVTTGGATDDGIYTVTAKGAVGAKYILTRAGDMNTSGSLTSGLMVPCGSEGSLNSNKVYELQTAAPFTLDSTSLTFGEFANTVTAGVIPSSRLAFSVNPTNNDTLGIGGSTFTFLTVLGAATTTTQVKILGSAALTIAALLDAINGVVNVNVVVNTTPFVASLVADAVSATVLRLRNANAQGGQAQAGTVTSTVLAASVSGGASAWSIANLNATGKADVRLQEAVGKVTITAGMITAGSIALEFPFAPGLFQVQAFSSAGVQRSYSDVTAVSGNALVLTLGGGASPNLQANDVVSFWVSQ